MKTSQAGQAAALPGNRWFYLALAVLLMCMISGVQYSWTLYASPLKDKLGISLAAVQTAFTLSQVIQEYWTPEIMHINNTANAR